MIETFQTPGHVSVEARIPEGRIELETSESSETVVELTGLDDEELAELATIELRERGDRYEVLVDVDDLRGFGLRFLKKRNLRLDVRLPNGADVHVSTASADTRGRGSFGALELESASGDVAFEEIEGNAEIKSASGDVNLRDVGHDVDVATASGDLSVDRAGGRVKVRSASGDVHVGEAGAGVSVQTASGDQQIDSVVEGEVTLRSASGDIHVGIKPGSRLWVDAKSMSGDTSSELEVGDTPASEEGPLVELRATAMSGDIRVVRA